MLNSQPLMIGNRKINLASPTYFIADIGANHDGDIERAKLLIGECAKAGADAAKFQHFKAETIVSDFGFKSLDRKFLSHQASWKSSVFEVYKAASIDGSWDREMKITCEHYGIDYITTPYDAEFIESVGPHVSAYKIGSGDITWLQHLKRIALKDKPVILACGASTLDEIVKAVECILDVNPNLAILQCNTNYTGQDSNFDYINLNVLNTFKVMFPTLCIGLSDHTPGHATVLGAVSLGCRIVEKHFTDDNSRIGPDHAFAMDPSSWKSMVDATRQLERALGSGVKKVEKNERDTVVIQRRSIRVRRPLARGAILTSDDVVMLRPCPIGSIEPWRLDEFLGKKVSRDVLEGEHLTESHFE